MLHSLQDRVTERELYLQSKLMCFTQVHRNINWNAFVYIVNLTTVVEGGLKAPFSTATTPRCRGGRYSFILFFLMRIYFHSQLFGLLREHSNA